MDLYQQVYITQGMNMNKASQEIHPVGNETVQTISRIHDEIGELETGNVVRRACMVAGEQACKQACQLRRKFELSEEDSAAREVIDQAIGTRACADMNLLMKLQKLGLNPDSVLMVGVTGDRVGFADQLGEYNDALTQNPYGWRELPGFNAFFARVGEIGALGRRLADCADINFEFTDRDGRTVFGFEHGTRPNMRGSMHYKFEKNGQLMSYTEYVLREAVDHYRADPASMRIRVAAAIKGHNFTKRFDNREKMEEHLPGWYADGFLTNVTNPSWSEGESVTEGDTWEADSRAMIMRDITEAMQQLGIPLKNLNTEGIIDPADTRGMHSSHQFRKEFGDTRDLYITFPKLQIDEKN
jgi:hypothetical protein